MIISVWKPKYKTIDKKNIISYYVKCDNNNILRKGNSNHRVIYKCDNIECSYPNKIHAINRHHLNKERSKNVNENIQICKKCQTKGKNNPRYNDNRSWDEIHGIEKSKRLKRNMSDRLYDNNPSHNIETNTNREISIQGKYGVKNVFQLNIVKEKIKKTNLEKYGVDSYTKTVEYLERTKETNLKKYGTEWQLQSDIIKEKIKKTNLKNYGVEWILQSDIIKEKIKETNLEKYGVENPLQSDIIKEKIKETNLEKYGSESHLMSDDYRKGKYIITNHPNHIKYLKKGISLFNCDCGEQHTFEIQSYLFTSRFKNKSSLCTICNTVDDKKSIKEKDVLRYIQSIYDGKIISGYRDGLEIDIYLPELKLGIEFNGLYWHSELYKDKNYHIDKTNYFKERGIRIIHIWEDDWDFNKDIIKSMVSNFIGTSNKIYARECEITEVTSVNNVRDFLNKNHIQGYVNSNLKLGIYHKGNLLSLMTFDHFEGRKKMGENEWNLSRFCNKLNTSVIGGASKLFKYFINNYNPKRVVSYADKTWSEGSLYYILGFNKSYETNPDYKYVIDDKRKHKSNYKKSKTNISESSLNMLKIYDCGKMKFQYINY